MFPSDRVRRAGASAEELAQLEAEYNADPPTAQEATDQHLGSISESNISAWLQERRDAGRFEGSKTAEEEPTSAPAPTAPASTPGAKDPAKGDDN